MIQFDEHVFQMGWFNHHPAVLCFLKHRIMTFMNQGHLLQTPWQQLHKGTGATWRLKQSVPICRVFGSFKKWWFKKKPVFSPCFLCVISCYHWKKHLGIKGVMIYNSMVSFLFRLPGMIDVSSKWLGLWIVGVGSVKDFLKLTYQVWQKKHVLVDTGVVSVSFVYVTFFFLKSSKRKLQLNVSFGHTYGLTLDDLTFWIFVKGKRLQKKRIPSLKLTWLAGKSTMNESMYFLLNIRNFSSDFLMLVNSGGCTLQETNISPQNGILKMIFLFPRWDMLIPWRVTSMALWSIMGKPQIYHSHMLEHFGDTVDGRNPANQLIDRLSHDLQGFVHLRWCRISSINGRSEIATNFGISPAKLGFATCLIYRIFKFQRTKLETLSVIHFLGWPFFGATKKPQSLRKQHLKTLLDFSSKSNHLTTMNFFGGLFDLEMHVRWGMKKTTNQTTGRRLGIRPLAQPPSPYHGGLTEQVG